MKVQQLSNIREVARLAGVSVGTVSNVLNRPQRVAEPTRLRVERAVEDLGYVLNGSARSLRAGRSLVLGLLVLDVTNPFFTEVARGVEDGANEAGYAVVLCNSDDSERKERRYLRTLEEQRAHGVIVTPVMREERLLHWLRGRGMGVVLLDRASAGGDLPSVAVDDVHGGRVAGEHLLELGHRRLALVTGSRSIQQCADRREGLRSAVSAAGLDPDEVIVEVAVPALVARSGEEAAARVLAADPAPTAVFCVNDLLALGLLRALLHRRVAVPDDLALVGYDDVEFASVLHTPLTTVHQPKYELGRAAVELLLAGHDTAGQGGHAGRRMFTPRLVVRESTAGTGGPAR
ncbi:MAG: LacI family DNA-binding transcriptional regulator [Egibacteraceae bacterium]